MGSGCKNRNGEARNNDCSHLGFPASCFDDWSQSHRYLIKTLETNQPDRLPTNFEILLQRCHGYNRTDVSPVDRGAVTRRPASGASASTLWTLARPIPRALAISAAPKPRSFSSRTLRVPARPRGNSDGLYPFDTHDALQAPYMRQHVASRLSYVGRGPRGRCAPRTPCSRLRTGECPRASVPAPD